MWTENWLGYHAPRRIRNQNARPAGSEAGEGPARFSPELVEIPIIPWEGAAHMRKHLWSPRLPALGILLLLASTARFAEAQTETPPVEATPPVEEATPPEGGETPPASDPEAEAKAVEAFNAAKQLYTDGKFVEALLEFKKAYKLKPTAGILYNIARCREQLSQWNEAIEAYEQFVKETDDPRARTEALDKLEFLKTKTGATGGDDPYKARVDAGRKAYTAGDYEGAITEFKAAYDLKATPGPLFNIAKSYERMARYEEAIDYYQQYLEAAPNAPDRNDVEEIVRRLQKSIRERYQEISISSDPPGADIYLDDRNTGLLGQTNSRFKIQPGPRKLFIDKNGFEPIERDFVMPDDKPLALEFSLKKIENSGTVTIKINVDGARIFVDGAIVGLSPYDQEKVLGAGKHQLQIEARGYPRYSREFMVTAGVANPIDIVLEEYSPPISDDTLSAWGRNLMIVGIIGGSLGIAGPFLYQKLFLRRDLYSQLGPSIDEVQWGGGVETPVFWTGEAGYTTDNGTIDTLSAIQVGSLIGGSVFVAAGLGFFIYKWVRAEDKTQVITSGLDGDDAPVVHFDNISFFPGPEGPSVGLSGRF